ncbi:short-chain dehydrogenase/reductase-like protein SDR [Mycena capillaripes]|nr:short-chain dehydrogenase/reductase-like protein SDR [Mycena capillaripes]
MNSPSDNFTPTIHHDTYAAIDPLKCDMSGKIIFISGASKGIGRAAALSFARAGATGIVIAARSEHLLATTEEELVRIDRSHLGQPPVVVMAVTMDICLRDSVEAAAARAQAFFGRVDILLNVAGISDLPRGIAESDPDDWSCALTTNLRGSYIVVKAILPLMTQVGSQSNRMIVNLVSASIHLPTFKSTAYTLSKLALLRMSEMLHLQYGDAPHNITVIGFHPGFVPTDLTRNLLPKDVQQHVLVDSPELAADSLVWLAQEPRPWLSGRYLCCNWDMTELEAMKDDILAGDKLKFKIVL